MSGIGPVEAAPPRSQLLSGYGRENSEGPNPEGPVFDEVLDAAGHVRPHYAGLVAELEELGAEELGRRSEAGRRISHEQGVSYNVYGEPRGAERAWELDPVPFLI